MEADNLGCKEATKLLGIHGLGSGDEVDHLGEPVHEDEDGIKAALGGWEVGDHVSSDISPLAVGDWQGLKSTIWEMVTGFDSLACGACGTEVLDMLGHAWPVEESLAQIDGAGSTEVPGEDCVMACFHDFRAELGCRYDELAVSGPP